MSLDDLLTSARDPRETPDPGRTGVWVWVRILVVCAVVSFAAYHVLLAVGFRVPYPLLLAVLVAALVLRRITAAARGTLTPPTSAVPRRRAENPERGQEFHAAWRWVAELKAVERDRDGFNKRVRPAVVALIDERLRLRHGVDRQRDPQRAQALLPEQVWRFVTEPVSTAPRPKQMAAIAEQVESL